MSEKMEVSGTDSRSKFLEEGRLLPWRLVTFTTWTKLANKLDLPSPVSNNDWRGLAEQLGFTTEDILVLESNNTERKTIALFRNFMPQSDATVNKVARALKQMNRDDALQILLDAVPDIELRLAEEQQRAAQGGAMEAVETEDHYLGSLPQGGCRCLSSPTSVHLGSQHTAGSCSPCHAHSHCSYMAGGCCFHRLPSHHPPQHCHTSPAQCSAHHTHSPISSNPRSIPLVTSPMTHTSLAGGSGAVTSMAPLKYNVSAGPMQHEDTGRSKTHMAEGGLYGPETLALHSQQSSLPAPQSSMANLQQQQQHRYRQQMSSNNSSAYPQRGLPSESMAVHPDMCQEQALQSFSSDMMEIERGQSEEPAPLPNTIARGQGQLMSGMGTHPLPIDVSMDDEPSTTTEELSSSDSLSSNQQNGGGMNIVRQISEECNAKQPFTASPGYNSTHKSNIDGRRMSPSGPPVSRQSSSPWPRSGTLRGQGLEDCPPDRRGMELGERGGFTKGQTSDQQSSLHHLLNLSKLPDRFMPGSKYTTIVAGQQIDDTSPTNGKRVAFPPNIKRERGDPSRPCRYPSSDSTDNSTTSSRSGGSSGSRSRGGAGGENPHTFPMRVKPQTGGSMVEDVRRLQPGQLTKTTSVPIDMKVEEFRKAFRHIKVFVTYANESKQHSRQVLSLCNCLDRNGFSCCVDVYSRHEDSADQQQASRDWCTRKFKEADFVIVCISPQYLREIEVVDSSSPVSNSDGLLHAAYIYQLMVEEYQSSGKYSRFVPLYFDGTCSGQGPGWLTGQLVYHWPRQYKDLLWMLTKPEERIKQRPKGSSRGRNHSSGSLNGHRSPMLSSVH